MLNKTLSAAIANVMSAYSPAQYLLSLQLLSTVNTSFTYSPMIIDQLTIKQDFFGQYTDNITISFEVASNDYASIQDNSQGLTAVLKITYLDHNGKIVYTPPPQTYTFNATLVNPKDVRRQLSDVSARTTPDTTMTLRLIDKTVYDLRHIQINGIYQKTTLSDAISHISQTFKFKTMHLVNPDNTHTYDHLIIPPSKGFSEIYTYLQTKYGVYMKGLNFYATNGVLYIYPPYETGVVFPQTVQIYQADDGAYAGAPSFHSTTGTTTQIVVNKESRSGDLTITSGENKGTASMFLRASSLMDGVVSIDSKKGAAYQPNVAATLRMNNPRLATPNTHNSSYGKATDNLFSVATNLASGQAVMMEVVWGHAQPFLLMPGCAVRYSYDKNGAQMTMNGILEGIQCTLNRDTRVSAGMLCLSSGKLILRLEPDASVTG